MIAERTADSTLGKKDAREGDVPAAAYDVRGGTNGVGKVPILLCRAGAAAAAKLSVCVWIGGAGIA